MWPLTNNQSPMSIDQLPNNIRVTFKSQNVKPRRRINFKCSFTRVIKIYYLSFTLNLIIEIHHIFNSHKKLHSYSTQIWFSSLQEQLILTLKLINFLKSEFLKNNTIMAANKGEEPVLGIPYNGGNQMMYHPQTQPQPQFFYVGENPYQNGAIPPNAIFDDPKGVPIHQTFYRDTPAPFSCVYCGHSSITSVKFVSFLSFFFVPIQLFSFIHFWGWEVNLWFVIWIEMYPWIEFFVFFC